jgi:hypothetical protein
MKATKEQIVAEANRRAVAQGYGAPPVEHFIVDVVCENWTPPEPEVDPDVLAFREWNAGGARVITSVVDVFLAGARMAREQEQERANALVAFAVRVKVGVFKDLDDAKCGARKAIDEYEGEA